MKKADIIRKIESQDKNIHRHGNIYIAPENMKKFASWPTAHIASEGYLITPYLISGEAEGKICELSYCEVTFDIEDNVQSQWKNYSETNSLPQEILESIRPQAIVAKGDKTFFYTAVLEYLTGVENMHFEKERAAHESLATAQLFYQIF